MILDLSDLVSGEIRPVTDAICVARLGNDVFAFARYCPHGGADLSLGYLENQSIRCCWHNLAIDPRTGHSSCKSISKLKVFSVRPLEAERFEITSEERLDSTEDQLRKVGVGSILEP